MIEFDTSNIEIQFEYGGDEAAEIVRCLKMLYSTPAGTVALDREFGLSWDMIDMPIETAKSILTVEIIEKTAKYEPRVSVSKVIYKQNVTGKLITRVVVRYVRDF